MTLALAAFRWDHISDEPFPLSLPFTDILELHKDRYDTLVQRSFQEASASPRCLVLDGNQKLTRRTCAEMMVSVEPIAGTNLSYMQDCTKTPQRKSAFCSAHKRPASRDCGVRVCKKACCVGENPQALLRTTPTTGLVDWPLPDWLRDQLHLQSKAAQAKMRGEDADIRQAADFVSCSTIKMRKRVNRRSGGWLVACDERGLILEAQEFFGGESLTQRAAMVASVISHSPSIQTIVHDDACHLQKFMDRWFKSAPHLCAPALSFVIDKFHSSGHTDAWCRANCAPTQPHNKVLLQNVNTSSCELLFSWFSKFKHSFRHMNRLRAHFFVSEILLMRNAWRQTQLQARQQSA